MELLTFDTMFQVVEKNINNPSIKLDIKEYRKTICPLKLNKNNYLKNLLKEFNNEKNILYTSMENIVNNSSFKIISLEDFFFNLEIIFKKIICKIEELYKL